MTEHAVYNSEDGKWYRQGDDPWTVREVKPGQKLQPLVFAVADSYPEAFEKLFGHAIVIPPPTHEQRHRQEA